MNTEALMEQFWDEMVAHSAIASRTTGAERIAARLAARKAYLAFEALRIEQDRAYLASRH